MLQGWHIFVGQTLEMVSILGVLVPSSWIQRVFGWRTRVFIKNKTLFFVKIHLPLGKSYCVFVERTRVMLIYRPTKHVINTALYMHLLHGTCSIFYKYLDSQITTTTKNHGLWSQLNWLRSKVECVDCIPSRAFFSGAPHSPPCPRQTAPACHDRSGGRGEEMGGRLDIERDFKKERERGKWFTEGKTRQSERDRPTLVPLWSLSHLMSPRWPWQRSGESESQSHSPCKTWQNQSQKETFTHQSFCSRITSNKNHTV